MDLAHNDGGGHSWWGTQPNRGALQHFHRTFAILHTTYSVVNTPDMPDRGRLRSDRRRGTQLDTAAYPVLGYRYLARRAFPTQGRMEVCSQGIRLGTEVWHPHHARYSLHSRIPKRVWIPLRYLYRVLDGCLSRYNHSGKSNTINVLNGVMVSTIFDVYRKSNCIKHCRASQTPNASCTT
jgi:hypothetical protein